jgi:MtN3 and saliva related transmembrane protein
VHLHHQVHAPGGRPPATLSVSGWLPTAVGSVAAIFTTVAFIPQVVRVVRLKRAEELSVTTFAVFSVGTVGWLAYGLLIGSDPVILANVITLALAATIVAVALRWRGPPSSN